MDSAMPDVSDQIIFGLGRISALLRSGHRQDGAAFELNPTQVEILIRVASRPARAGTLADHLGVTAATISDSLRILESKGQIERRPDPADGRAILIHPTQAGRGAAAVLGAGQAPLRSSLSGLGAPEKAGLLRALTVMIRALQEARAIPVQRLCVTCRHFRPNLHASEEHPHHCEFVDAAFGDASLRLDCSDHEAAPAEEAAARWRRFDAA